MQKNICPNCKEEYTGRSNQLYCSSRCKSAANNAHINKQNQLAKKLSKTGEK